MLSTETDTPGYEACLGKFIHWYISFRGGFVSREVLSTLSGLSHPLFERDGGLRWIKSP